MSVHLRKVSVSLTASVHTVSEISVRKQKENSKEICLTSERIRGRDRVWTVRGVTGYCLLGEVTLRPQQGLMREFQGIHHSEITIDTLFTSKF